MDSDSGCVTHNEHDAIIGDVGDVEFCSHGRHDVLTCLGCSLTNCVASLPGSTTNYLGMVSV